jgi:hypothetical protein
LGKAEQEFLDRVKANFAELMEDPPMLENSVKMAEYANSRLFSLVNPNNELYTVLHVLKRFGMEAIANG